MDSSDPVGPAESLCKPEFYESMKAVGHCFFVFLISLSNSRRRQTQALSPGGIIACQCESIWLHLPFIVTVSTVAERIS